MKQDSIFYQLFKRSPTLLFELIPTNSRGNVYFGEVQQAIDNLPYERLMAEISIFAYRDRETFKDWRAVVIYPSRDIEQERLEVVQEFLDSGRITRIYLDELGAIKDLPWGLALMALTILPSDEMLAKAKEMLQQFSMEEATSTETSSEGSAILDLVTTAIVYKFPELSRDEVLAMLGLELKEPRAFRETRAEGKAEATKKGIEAILLVRFGEIDEELTAIVPKLMELDIQEYTRLLLNLSRSELLALPESSRKAPSL